MKAYDAILRTADSIERFPDMFKFISCDRPDFDCGTPGCALGWISYHMGGPEYWWQDPEFYRAIGYSPEDDSDDHEFYARMDELSDDCRPNWRHNADSCAAALRAYAEKYHAHEKPKHLPIKHEGIPDWCRGIFEESEKAA